MIHLFKTLPALALLVALVGTVSAQDAAVTPMTETAMPMQPREISGVLLRQYVDVAGNVSAMDIKTADGVRQVRFAPAMMSGDARMESFRMGSPVTVTGMVGMGMTSYDPNGPLGSGLLMKSSNSTPMAARPAPAAGGMMMGDWARMMPRGTDLSSVNFDSATQLAQSPIKAIVHLSDGRASVIREMNGQMVYLSPETNLPIAITMNADGTMSSESAGLPKNARIMMPGAPMAMDTATPAATQ